MPLTPDTPRRPEPTGRALKISAGKGVLAGALMMALGLVGCATTGPNPSAADLATLMEGTFTRPPSDPAGPLRDRRVRIDPLGPGEWLYYQVNQGERLQDVYRQRVLQLEMRADGSVAQSAYTLDRPERFAALGMDPGAALATIVPSDLGPDMGPGCEMIWIAMPDIWIGRIDPTLCLITSERTGSRLRIESRADLTRQRMRQAETGYTPGGDRIWGSDDGDWMTLVRTGPNG